MDSFKPLEERTFMKKSTFCGMFQMAFILSVFFLVSCQNTVVTQFDYVVFSITPDGQGYASVSVFDPEENTYRITLPYETTTTTFSTLTSDNNSVQVSSLSGETEDGDDLNIRANNSSITLSGLETGENQLQVELIHNSGNRLSYSITIEVLDFLNLAATALDSENSDYQLDGAFEITNITIGDRTYLFVGSTDDDGISTFEWTPQGELIHRQKVNDSENTNYELDEIWGVEVASFGNKHFLFVSGTTDNGVSVFEIAADGSLTNTANVTDNATLSLDGAAGITTAEIGGKLFLFVSAHRDNGVNVFEVSASGTLTSRASVTDTAAINLAGARDVDTITIGTRTFLIVAGRSDNGISVFEVANNGSLTHRDKMNDSNSLYLRNVSSVETDQATGIPRVIATGFNDSGISVFTISATGNLTNTENTSGGDELNPINSHLSLINGQMYLYSSWNSSSALVVYELSSQNTLTKTHELHRSDGLRILGLSDASTATIRGKEYVFLSSNQDNSLNVFELGLR